jgi:CBS domain-containing protein
MTNRSLAYIVKNQKPATVAVDTPVRTACNTMWKSGIGSVLVVDAAGRLKGIFTGRDAVKALAAGSATSDSPICEHMTRDPVTITPDRRAIDALRVMCEGRFRHLPVVEDDGGIWGVVSRSDFSGSELDRLQLEEHLWECIR